MPQQKQEVVLARRHEVASYYLAGRYQSEIAQMVGCSQQQVSADLAVLRQQWLTSSLRDFDAAKAEELAKIDRAEREYWQGWEASKQAHIVTLAEVTRGEKPSRKRSRRRENQYGDPRFLDGVLTCIKQRCAVLGLSMDTEALKEAGIGMALLLEQARQLPVPLSPVSQSLAEA